MSENKSIVIPLDPEMHAELKACADHYGASLRGTILRYVRMGIAVDKQVIARELAGRPYGDAHG